MKSPEQWLALARHRFGALHGAAAAEWDVKVTETAPLGARLACAVDRELVEGLASAFVGAGVHLVSVQPFLVAAFNRIRQTVGNGSCWIVVEEPGRLTLALIQRGAWVAIRSRRSDERWRTMLPEILERGERVPGPRPAVHARHRVRAGRVRHRDARRLARAGAQLPRPRTGVGMMRRIDLDFCAARGAPRRGSAACCS